MYRGVSFNRFEFYQNLLLSLVLGGLPLGLQKSRTNDANPNRRKPALRARGKIQVWHSDSMPSPKFAEESADSTKINVGRKRVVMITNTKSARFGGCRKVRHQTKRRMTALVVEYSASV